MVALGGALLAAVLAAAPATSDVGERARQVLEDGSYQRALPQAPPPPTPHSFDLGIFDFLLHAAGVIAVLLAVAWLVWRLAAGRERDVAAPLAGPAAALEVELEEPERLAAAGRYAEAIHALLLETLAALSRAAQLPSSLTSREILQRVRLPERAREALEGLVLAVEVSRFGGVPAGEADYRVCLDRFHAFLETYRRPAREAA
jgi:hypothetical protein